MAFCSTCDEPVEIVSEDDDWTGIKDADHVTEYACTNDDCPNDGGKVWATESGRVVKEEGVW